MTERTQADRDQEGREMIRRYPPISMRAIDRVDGNVREITLDYSRITVDDAFMWSRDIEFFLTLLFQWRDLTHKMTSSATEERAAQLVKTELKEKKADATRE
jgi:hypothetical protein